VSTPGDDDLERRLRDVLHSRGLGVPVPPDAIDRIHDGAHRRQQRRVVATATAACAAVALVATAGVSIGARSHGHSSTADGHTASPSAFVSSSPSAVLSSISPVSPRASALASAALVEPTSSAVVSTPPVQVFNPVSVSAAGINDYWVLGYTTADSGPDGITIMKTTDGGQHFVKVGSPAAFVAQMGAKVPPGTPVVSDIRFGDTTNGWAYGGGLFATKDGGTSWSAVTDVPGSVVDLAAASGDVWAISDTETNGTDSYALYHATYGSAGSSGWTQLQLGATSTGQPSLAVIKKTAYLLEGETASQVTYVIANGGNSYTTQPGPCSATPNLGAGELSVAGDGSLWAWCSAGNESGVYVSVDGAAHWQGMIRTTTTSVRGIDSSHAVVSDGTSIGTLTLGHSVTTPAIPDPSTQPDATFIGFTTTQFGFAIVTQQVVTSRSLWRTTDGGQTWTVVNFG
jgi:hypothetical protein